MSEDITSHYASDDVLSTRIAEGLALSGLNLKALTAKDLAVVDEFHVRGRVATLELAAKMRLTPASVVLDIGSGLGGPARTVAQTYGCPVAGIDLTQAFCDAAQDLSHWVNMADRVSFRQGDATALAFLDDSFDAIMTIHVGMNIASKDKMYAEAILVIKPGCIFAVYDILQGEGGDVHYPVPWAREPSISHLATPDQMKSLLRGAGFRILEITDSTAEGQIWFEEVKAKMEKDGLPPVTFQTFLGGDFPTMAKNQVRNLSERRIRTVTYICES